MANSRILYIEAQKKLKINKEKLLELEKILSSPVYIVYSIQYKKLAEEVKKELGKSKKIKIIGFSQILGCSELNTEADILLIGHGRFHAINLALSSDREVFIFDNFSISKITKEEIDKEKQKEKGKYLKFLASDKIGILISTKSGQENLKSAEKYKEQLKKYKKSYLFLSDNLNLQELENFPLNLYVNTACPGLSLDSSKIINYKTLEIMEK